MKKVVIVQRRLTHYRVPLFTALRESLAADSIRLELLAGAAAPSEMAKRDAGSLPWAGSVGTRYLAGERLCWAPFGHHVRGADLVIVTQENRLLYNHYMLMRPRSFALAFWGHGANLQAANPNSLAERYKRWTTARVDWWFAYTSHSVRLVEQAGFAGSRITNLENAVDTRQLRQARAALAESDVARLRDELGVADAPVGIFVGSLYGDKRLDFLVECADAIRRRVPAFNLVIVGEGPLRAWLDAQARTRPWLHCVGARFGKDKVRHVAMADLMLNPGLVGLGILDSFSLGVPMVTTDCGLHSPEIAYLESGSNGVMTANCASAYVEAVCGLLADRRKLERLRMGCLESASRYTIENMTNNFHLGIRQALTLGLAAA